MLQTKVHLKVLSLYWTLKVYPREQNNLKIKSLRLEIMLYASEVIIYPPSDMK